MHKQLNWLYRIPPAGPLLVLFIIGGAMFVPEFLSLNNLLAMAFSSAVLLPAVLGMQVLLVLGKFDLSIGAVAALSGMVAGMSVIQSNSIIFGVTTGLLTGLLFGLINGAIVSFLKVDPLLATLATMSAALSLALAINGGRIVSGLPNEYSTLTAFNFIGFPVLILFAVFLTITLALISKHAVFFRRLYAAGSNPVAANHAGVKVTILIAVAYGIAGLGAALTGLIQTSRTLSASPLVMKTLAIESIAACIIGGSSLTGGRGSASGAAMGILAIVASRNFIVMVGIPIYWKDFMLGTLLLLAVLGGAMRNGWRAIKKRRKNT